MAIDITVNINDEREVTLLRMTSDFNKESRGSDPAWVDLTPSQFFRQYSRNIIDSRTSDYAQRDRLGLRAAYELATPAERATIDAILDQYRE